MNKSLLVKAYIVEYAEKYGAENVKFSGATITRIADELETTTGTVYSAIRKMRTDGLMLGNQYRGSQWVKFTDVCEVVKSMIGDQPLLINDEKLKQIARTQYTSVNVILYHLNAAIKCGVFKEFNGGIYGRLIGIA